MDTYHNNDSGGESFDNNPGPPTDGLDLLTDPIDAAGEPVDLTRGDGDGEFVEPDPDRTDFGVDRGGDGEFVTRDRAPATLIRHDDGELGANPFAVGEFGEFDDEFRYSTTGGDR